MNCSDWLWDLLKKGNHYSCEVIRNKAKEKGFTRKELKEARRELCALYILLFQVSAYAHPTNPPYTIGSFQYLRLYICPPPGNTNASQMARLEFGINRGFVSAAIDFCMESFLRTKAVV